MFVEREGGHGVVNGMRYPELDECFTMAMDANDIQ